MPRKNQSSKPILRLNDVLLAIRKKCMDCCGNQSKYVKSCHCKDCPLHPYRTLEELEKFTREDN